MTSRRYKPPEPARLVSIVHDGKTIPAYEGEPLASALMAAGVRILSRSSKYHRPRGSTCGSGDCARCLVTIDGLPNRCACTTPCREGMESRSQNVLGSAEHDLLGITDWMFPWGLDHHEMFTGVPLVQPVVQKVVRQLSGLGVLAGGAKEQEDGGEAPDIPGGRTLSSSQDPISVDVLVVGAGASGLSAAGAARAEGASVLLAESRRYAGGRLTSGIHGPARAADQAVESALGAGVALHTGAGVIEINGPDDLLEALLLTSERLLRVSTSAVVLATGGYPSVGIFENNDLPGVLSAEWAARLLSLWGVLAGERPLICADEPEVFALRALFEEAGAPPVRVLPLSAAYALSSKEQPPVGLIAAKGGRQVERAVIQTPEGRETVSCDVILVASPPAPAFELAHDAGAAVSFEPRSCGFSIVAEDDGRTAGRNIFASGTLTGPCSVEDARSSGESAGRAAAAAALFGTDRPRSGREEDRHAS